jgi:hypothetical protein
MIKYIKDILTTITPGQRLFALVFLLIAITLMTVGPRLFDSVTMDHEELNLKVNRQKTEIFELNSRVGELTQQVLDNQRSCTNDLIAKEKEILGIITSIEIEMERGQTTITRTEKRAETSNRMIRRSPSSTEDTIQVAYSIIPDEPEPTIIETRTDNSKALNSIKQLKKKISSDIEEKKKQ